jgi:uncharacterized membrane protein YkvA (DUF1232 family)
LSTWAWFGVLAGALLLVYAAFVAWLFLAGHRGEARALAGFIPDCVVLFKRLLGDPEVDRWRKVLLGGMLLYLAFPLDLVPDFIPVAGQLDDLILVALVLRSILLGAGEKTIRRHWRGPSSSLELILRAARGGRGRRAGR